MSGVAEQPACRQDATGGERDATGVGATSPGPVALVGSGEYLDVMVEIDRGLLTGRPARAVFLPTAAAEEGPDSVNYWVELGTRHFERLGVEPVPLRVLDRRDADRSQLAAMVEGAGLVYLSGGNPGYLAETLRGTRVWSAILEAWRTGTALAGCSAGACALSRVAGNMRSRAGSSRPQPDSTGAAPTKGSPEGGSAGSGLAVVPRLAVIPHYDRILEWVPDLRDRYFAQVGHEVTVVGVDEDTALVSPAGDGVRFAVAGRQAAWVLYRDGTSTRHGTGSTFSLE